MIKPNEEELSGFIEKYRNNAAKFIYDFTDLFVDHDGTRQELYPKQVEFMNLIKPEQKIVSVVKARQCFDSSTFVYTEHGPKTVKQLHEEGYKGKVWTNDQDGNAQLDEIVDIWPSGKKEVYEVKLWTGEKVRLTAEHEVMTDNGWKKTKDLVVGDVVWNSETPFGDVSPKDEEVILMGYFITDGSFSSSMPKFVNNNMNYIEEFERCVHALFDVKTTRYKESQRPLSTRVVVGKPVSGGNNPSEYAKYLTDLGCKQIGDKRVLPEKFLKMTKEKTALLLNRMFAGDGWYSSGVNVNRPNKKVYNEIGIGSPSLEFIHQISFLLNKFGIHARVETMKFKNVFYKLRFSNQKYVEIFHREIGIFDKELRVEKNQLHLEHKKRNRVKDIKKIDGLCDVFDLETKKYNSFIANGIHIHNCGISTAIIGRTIHSAYFNKVPATLICSASQRQSIEVLEKIKKAIDSMPDFMRPALKRETKEEIVFESGSKITSLPVNPKTARGYSGDVILDEFGVLSKKESEEMWEALYPSTIKGWRITCVSSPKGTDNVFYHLCNPTFDLDGNNTSQYRADKVMKIMWTDVPHVKEAVLKDGTIEKSPPKLFAQEYECEFVNSDEEVFFNLEKIQENGYDPELKFANISELISNFGTVIPTTQVRDDIIKKYSKGVYLGYDPATSHDGSVLVAIGKREDDVWELFSLYIFPNNTNLTAQAEFAIRMAKMFGARMIGLDSSAGLGHAVKQQFEEKEFGHMVVAHKFTNEFKFREYSLLRNLFDVNKFKMPEGDSRIWDQFRRLGFNPVNKRIAAIGRGKDDIPSAIICALACKSEEHGFGFAWL